MLGERLMYWTGLLIVLLLVMGSVVGFAVALIGSLFKSDSFFYVGVIFIALGASIWIR